MDAAGQLMWILAAVATGVLLLMHLAPFPFLLDWANRDVAMWRVPQPPGGREIYLTFDDGPNPDATPALLDVLAGRRASDPFWAPEPGGTFLDATRREPGRLRIARFVQPVIADVEVSA